jgi:signal transduction histidine kinase
MKSLYLRIYLTVVAAVALFALVSGWFVQRHLDDQRVRSEGVARERAEAWGELLQKSLPAAGAPTAEQAMALRDWSQRLRMPLALDDAQGKRVGTSDSFARREFDGPNLETRAQPIRFDDGRTLWAPRPGAGRGGAVPRPGERSGWLPPGVWPANWPDSLGLALLLLLLFAAVASGAWPVVRRLTRRLENLKQGVDAFGSGALGQRVAEDGRDEVAALGASFNRAATRIEALVRSHQSLLANASHELRSPLARLKMAVAMAEDAPPEKRAAMRKEIDTNIGELNALVEEVLLASRLNGFAGGAAGAADLGQLHHVDLLGLAAEEAQRVGAEATGSAIQVQGDERLLRRAVRNLLENAQRYGGPEVQVHVAALAGQAELRVCDRGPGVPESLRERIFEAFFRLPGHAEHAGGVGLGLALVRQIAERHQGQVRCEAREGGGSCFVLLLPRV